MSRDDFKRLIEKNQEIEHLKKETQDIIEKVKDIDLREFKELIQKHDFYLKRLIELHPSKFSYQEKNMGQLIGLYFSIKLNVKNRLILSNPSNEDKFYINYSGIYFKRTWAKRANQLKFDQMLSLQSVFKALFFHLHSSGKIDFESRELIKILEEFKFFMSFPSLFKKSNPLLSFDTHNGIKVLDYNCRFFITRFLEKLTIDDLELISVMERLSSDSQVIDYIKECNQALQDEIVRREKVIAILINGCKSYLVARKL